MANGGDRSLNFGKQLGKTRTILQTTNAEIISIDLRNLGEFKGFKWNAPHGIVLPRHHGAGEARLYNILADLPMRGMLCLRPT